MTTTIDPEASPSPMVWVIDDESVNRALVAAVLHRVGWGAREFDSATAVVDALGEETPAAVFIDIRMPGMSGDQLLPILRNHFFGRHVRYVAYTAHYEPEELAQLEQAGFDLVLLKPVSYRDILAAVMAEPERAHDRLESFRDHARRRAILQAGQQATELAGEGVPDPQPDAGPRGPG